MFQKQKESPYRTVEYQSLQHNKQTTIKQLEIVFTFYAGKGSKYNYQELNQKYFTQMVAQLFQLAGMEKALNRKSPKWLSISTLYYSKGRSKPLYFSQFLELIPGIAKCMFYGPGSKHQTPQQTELEQEQATKNILILLERMYHIIVEEEIFRRGIKSQDIQEDTKEFLLKLKDSLTRLYKIYFQYEINLKDREKDYQNRSFECFLEIMKDFDVFPKLVSASQLFFIYNEVLDERQHNHLALLSQSLYSKTAFPKLGEHFTLTRFVEGLILTSHIGVSKLKRVEGQELLFSQTGLTQKEGIKMLLEYMETMRSVKGKYCKYTKQRFSLIVYQEYAEYVSKKEDPAYSSMTKQGTINNSPESKKGFFDILHKINL